MPTQFSGQTPSNLWVFFNTFVKFIFFYTESGNQIVFSVIAMIFTIVLPHALVYEEKSKILWVLETLSIAIAQLLI